VAGHLPPQAHLLRSGAASESVQRVDERLPRGVRVREQRADGLQVHDVRPRSPRSRRLDLRIRCEVGVREAQEVPNRRHPGQDGASGRPSALRLRLDRPRDLAKALGGLVPNLLGRVARQDLRQRADHLARRVVLQGGEGGVRDLGVRVPCGPDQGNLRGGGLVVQQRAGGGPSDVSIGVAQRDDLGSLEPGVVEPEGEGVDGRAVQGVRRILGDGEHEIGLRPAHLQQGMHPERVVTLDPPPAEDLARRRVEFPERLARGLPNRAGRRGIGHQRGERGHGARVRARDQARRHLLRVDAGLQRVHQPRGPPSVPGATDLGVWKHGHPLPLVPRRAPST
jgi:hypothetical protein